MAGRISGMDILYIAIPIVLFAATIGFLLVCERLMRRSS
jgi:hypothetical protein